MEKTYQRPRTKSTPLSNGKTRKTKLTNNDNSHEQMTLFIGVVAIDGSGWYQQEYKFIGGAK